MLERIPDHTVATGSGPEADATAPPALRAAASVRVRMRARQVEMLDGDLLAGAANIPAVAITAYVIRSSIAASELYLWVAAMTVALAALALVLRGLRPWRAGPAPAPDALARRLATHVFFTSLVGAVWGGACAAFGPGLPTGQMMFLTVIVMGCNAACISALGPYLPAFFGYFFASLLPLAGVVFRRPEPEAGALGLLVLLYMATITVNVRAYNRQVLAAFRLRAENEALAETVTSANAATAAAMRSKWDTLAHLSHELRTPMNAILGFSEMMREQLFGPLGERYLAYSGSIHDSGRRTLDLIDTLLEVSRAEAGQLSLKESEVPPSALLDEALSAVAAAAGRKRLTLERRCEPALPRLLVDRAKLRQALVNLLANAVSYTPEGGRVSVTARAAAGGVEIAVADTGVGIAARDLERCLEPFVRLGDPLTTGVEGAGLGLPLTKRLVEMHGGSLALRSDAGRGTTATLRPPPERCLAEAMSAAG